VEDISMEDLVRRWQRAAERASEEQVRVIQLPDGLYATSSSQPLRAYRLHRESGGWACECVANEMHHLPCKHLAALADVLDLDVLSEMRVDWPPAGVKAAA
jgi:hypothetical protein